MYYSKHSNLITIIIECVLCSLQDKLLNILSKMSVSGKFRLSIEKRCLRFNCNGFFIKFENLM